MKNSTKYVISAIIFFILFALIQYLFYQSIDWTMISVTAIIYGVVNAVLNKLLNN